MPPSVASSMVTASTMRPSRLAGCQAAPVASSARSHRAPASSITRDGGQVKPRGMLLPLALTTPLRRAALALLREVRAVLADPREVGAAPALAREGAVSRSG